MLFVRTLLYSLAVALTCFLAGGLAGSALWLWRGRRARVLRWLLLILAPLPPYIHGLAWSSLVGAVNRQLRTVGLVEIPFRGMLASWWVESMALLPIAAGIALIGFLMIDREQLEAASLEGSSSRWIRDVVIPLVLPVLAAGSGVVFILSLVDYSVPSLFQMNVYAMEIFADFSASNDEARAFLLGLPLWLAAMAALGLVLRGERGWSAMEENLPKQPLQLPAWLRAAQRFSVVVLLAHILVPLVSQVLLVGSLEALFRAVSDAAGEIRVSLLVAAASSLLAVPLVFTAWKLFMNARWKGWRLLVFAPITLPASLMGIGLVTLWNSLLRTGIYGTLAMPVLASTARFVPFAVLLASAQMSSIREELFESARIYQGRWVERIVRIDLPLYAPGLAAAAALVFILAIGELGATLIVAPPGRGTLTMRIYNYLHYGASDMVAGLCLAVTLVTVTFGLAAVFLYHGANRRQRRKDNA